MLEKGINLHIDETITEVCKYSNRSSSQTRAVLNLVIVITVLQLIAFMNTFSYSWHTLKHEKATSEYNNSIHFYNQYLVYLDSHQYSNFSKKYASKWLNIDCVEYSKKNPESLKNILTSEIRFMHLQLLQLDRYDLENYELLKLPLINVSIHVNDIGFLSGVILCTLFLILVFTLEREEANLILTLNAITNRYSDNSDYYLFEKEISELPLQNRVKTLTWINKTRRSFHYNLLTMNEIYTQPDLSNYTNINLNFLTRIKKKFLASKYYFPIALFLITFLHDFTTSRIGFENYSMERTKVHIVLMFLSLCILCGLSTKCNGITKSILFHYNNFKLNDYKYIITL